MARRVPDNYVNVPARIAKFRTENPKGAIHTIKREVADDPEIVEVKAMIFRNAEEMELYAKTGIATATGYAQTFGVSEVEKGVEKAESVAIGRALANLGYAAVDEDSKTESAEEETEETEKKEESDTTSRFGKGENNKSRFNKKSASKETEEETDEEEEESEETDGEDQPRKGFTRKSRFQRE